MDGMWKPVSPVLHAELSWAAPGMYQWTWTAARVTLHFFVSLLAMETEASRVEEGLSAEGRRA